MTLRARKSDEFAVKKGHGRQIYKGAGANIRSNIGSNKKNVRTHGDGAGHVLPSIGRKHAGWKDVRTPADGEGVCSITGTRNCLATTQLGLDLKAFCAQDLKRPIPKKQKTHKWGPHFATLVEINVFSYYFIA